MYGFNPELYQENNQIPQTLHEDSQKARYIEAYRRFGYKYANLNPVSVSAPVVGAELDSGHYGLSSGDQDVASLTQTLSEQYCGTMAIETGYMEDQQEVDWLCSKYQEIKDLPVEVSCNEHCTVFDGSLGFDI